MSNRLLCKLIDTKLPHCRSLDFSLTNIESLPNVSEAYQGANKRLVEAQL